MATSYRTRIRVKTLSKRFVNSDEFETELSELATGNWSIQTCGLANDRWYAVLTNHGLEQYETEDDA